MHIEALIQLFCLDQPWAIGRRSADSETAETLKDAPINEYPYFAMKTSSGTQFRFVGSDLDECVENLLMAPPMAEIVSVEGPAVPQGKD